MCFTTKEFLLDLYQSHISMFMRNTTYAVIATSAILLLVLSIPIVRPVSTSPRSAGYDHGCSDAQISDPSERYINQKEKGPSFHSDVFMQKYHEGFEACSGNSNNNDNSGSSDDSNSNSNDNSDQSSNSGSGSHSGLVDKACGWMNRHPGAVGLVGHLIDLGTVSTLAQGYCALR